MPNGSVIYGGTNDKVTFGEDGHIVLSADAKCYRDELGELLGKKRVGLRITEDLAEGTILFADNCQIADDYVTTNVQLNHDRDLTASIYPHLHWFQSSANVQNWLIQYRWQINGSAKSRSWTSLKLNTPVFTYSSGTIHQICNGTYITPPEGSSMSDIVQFRLSRDTDNDSTLFTGADPLTGNASALSFDIHLILDSYGSNTEYSKT